MCSGRGVELTKSFFNKGSYAIRSVLTRHPPCSVVWTAGQVICLILRTMNSLDFSADENWVCIHHITWFAGKHLPPSSACLKYGPMPLWPWWKSIVCLWQVFSDMICVNTYVIVSVMHVYSPVAALTMFWHIFWLHDMLGPWLAHCKSSWSCMNWNMSPKICALRKLFFLIQPWYIHRQSDWRRHPCRMEGKWTNYPTCFALLDVSFMVILRRAGW